jgi:hypothetical protein
MLQKIFHFSNNLPSFCSWWSQISLSFPTAKCEVVFLMWFCSSARHTPPGCHTNLLLELYANMIIDDTCQALAQNLCHCWQSNWPYEIEDKTFVNPCYTTWKTVRKKTRITFSIFTEFAFPIGYPTITHIAHGAGVQVGEK